MKIGVRIDCEMCGLQKKPHGRSGPMFASFCTDECDGYNREPKVGCLWPGETDEEFGYECCSLGTREVS